MSNASTTPKRDVGGSSKGRRRICGSPTGVPNCMSRSHPEQLSDRARTLASLPTGVKQRVRAMPEGGNRAYNFNLASTALGALKTRIDDGPAVLISSCLSTEDTILEMNKVDETEKMSRRKSKPRRVLTFAPAWSSVIRSVKSITWYRIVDKRKQNTRYIIAPNHLPLFSYSLKIISILFPATIFSTSS